MIWAPMAGFQYRFWGSKTNPRVLESDLMAVSNLPCLSWFMITGSYEGFYYTVPVQQRNF